MATRMRSVALRNSCCSLFLRRRRSSYRSCRSCRSESDSRSYAFGTLCAVRADARLSSDPDHADAGRATRDSDRLWRAACSRWHGAERLVAPTERCGTILLQIRCVGPTKAKSPALWPGFVLDGCLTMTYFRAGAPHYHRRAAVSRSCSGWEGVVPAGYGRQALTGIRVGDQESEKSSIAAPTADRKVRVGLSRIGACVGSAGI